MASKIVLIGAGSAQFGFGTLGDIFRSKVLKGSEVVLHDINPEALKKVAAASFSAPSITMPNVSLEIREIVAFLK